MTPYMAARSHRYKSNISGARVTTLFVTGLNKLERLSMASLGCTVGAHPRLDWHLKSASLWYASALLKNLACKVQTL
jgi:hypothetical protein